jgi:hypothetical protein
MCEFCLHIVRVEMALMVWKFSRRLYG